MGERQGQGEVKGGEYTAGVATSGGVG